VDLGVFLPIGNNGWLMSTAAPQYMPTYELNRAVTQKAESIGFEFALSMIKLRGFGGATEFWDHNLESFTLMAGIAPVTERIKLYASTATLTLPPAIVARMAVTIDSMAPGRFGVNIVTGWQKGEYAQMGLWPGDQHAATRYEQSSEYVRVMRDLWDTGRCDLDGEFFHMEDCHLGPLPQGPIEIVCAGQSDRGMRFCAEFGDVQFVLGSGRNTPTAHRQANERLGVAAQRSGRDVGVYVLFMIIADETDEAAFARWDALNAAVDREAIATMTGRAATDGSDERSHTRQLAMPEGAINFNIGTLVGSYERVAAMLDEAAAVPGTKGIMLIFDDFLQGLEVFGDHIQPRMGSRRQHPSP
jgi:pyrimidine oxygenase